MSQTKGFADKVAFIWGVADILRGDFRAHEYGQVILPFVVLRRLECALAPTKAAVIKRAAELAGQIDNVEPLLLHVAAQRFYNTSPLDLDGILQDPPNAAANLRTYIAGFSSGAQEVLDRYGFEDKITRLDKANLLYQVISKFAEVDLSPSVVSNDAMGYIFEELLRRFSEMSNATAGEHFTPREVIALMVNLLLAPDSKALAGVKPIRTIYDPACGTGGMLTVAQERLHEMNRSAVLVPYGQELNGESWAIARSDLMIKGQDPNLIAFGNSLIIGDEEHPGDGFPGEKFDYLLANPPFGVDWNKYADAIRKEHDKGADGRYGPGLPRVSDGSMLFLLHMISKFKPLADDPTTPDIIEGGSRMGIVLSGSPLFSGSAGGGESEIRRWILENDLLEGIIALPDTMFYNTGINTYVWILTNRKTPDRAGKVVLLDAREMFEKLRKSLGDKRKYISPNQIDAITTLYVDALGDAASDKRVKVFEREAFGFQRITVEQPLRRQWRLTRDAIDEARHDKTWVAWAVPPKDAEDPTQYLHDVEQQQDRLTTLLTGLTDTTEATEPAFRKRLVAAIQDADLDVPDKVVKMLVMAAAVPAPDTAPLTDRKGNVLPDPDLRDQENVPLRPGFFALDDASRAAALVEDAEAYLVAEVHPWTPDAWIDHSKTKLGFEIPFTRHFYNYTPPRDTKVIDTELSSVEEQIKKLLKGLA